MKYHVHFYVNGDAYDLDVPANKTMLDVLRDELCLTGTKEGCGAGECGACTVIVDDVPLNACLVLAPELDGVHITTVEGLSDGPKLSPLQQSFIKHGALQCGFCTCLLYTSIGKSRPIWAWTPRGSRRWGPMTFLWPSAAGTRRRLPTP